MQKVEYYVLKWHQRRTANKTILKNSSCVTIYPATNNPKSESFIVYLLLIVLIEEPEITMRTFLKILGALIVIIIVILFWILETVDYTPYFESHYYYDTKTRLDSLSRQLSLAKGKEWFFYSRV